MKIGALEAGGTKMVCAVGNEYGEIEERVSIPTLTPEKTVPEMLDFFRGKGLDAMGIASFGPVDPDRNSKMFGYITTTPKLAWQNYDLRGVFVREFGIPTGFDTDVNGACLGEATWGAAKDVDSSIYITIGTGVGVGVMAEGKLLHGMLHCEGGHVLLTRHPEDHFPGNCPFHPNCLEGLAAGPAIEARWGKKAYELADRAEVWELEAFYIGQALTDYILTLSPKRIVLGGGVMHQEQLLPMVRKEVARQLGGYLKTRELENLEDYIVKPALKDNQGVMGCIRLATMELERNGK